MLHLIPPRMHRALYRLAYEVRKVWCQIRKPGLAGCRVLALDSADRVLLIRHSYGSSAWMPPGGGIGRHENALEAARRELLEETGCALSGAVQIALTNERLHGASNAVHLVVGRTNDNPRADGREIIAAQFFALDALPHDMPDWLRRQLPGWITTARAAHRQGAAGRLSPQEP